MQARTSANKLTDNLKFLWIVIQHLTTTLCHQHQIFHTDTCIICQINTRLNRENHTRNGFVCIHRRNITKLMLSHRPSLAPESAKAGASLQLSGHTHGGLILPVTPLIAAFNGGYVSGPYTVDGMPLYVSSGSGLWGGIPLRLFVPSEITLITLTGTGFDTN